MCSIEKDIEYFVNQRKTGQIPPGEWNSWGRLLNKAVPCHVMLRTGTYISPLTYFFFFMILLAPIMYENFYTPQKNAAPHGKATAPNIAR